MRTKVLALVVFLALATAGVYTVLIVNLRQRATLARIDEKLRTAATCAREIAGAHYHDALSRSQAKVHEPTFLVNRDRYDQLCRELGLSYIWSLMELDGELVFTNATTNHRDDPDPALRTHAAFLEPHTDPGAYADALSAMTPTYATFHDKWGEGRMILLPGQDAQGRKYIFAASIPLDELSHLIQSSAIEGILLGLIVAASMIGLGWLLLRPISKPLTELTAATRNMADGHPDEDFHFTGSREIEELSSAFNDMRHTIERTILSLRTSEENLATTLNSIGDGVIATDAEGRITLMNPVAEALTGWTLDEARQHELADVFRIVNAFTYDPVENPVTRVLETGGTVGLANHTILIAQDGTERQIADSGAPIRDTSGTIIGVVLVFRDVSEEYQLQDQLRHAQKMEAIGQLAGGIAHDFNNLLMSITGNTDLLAEEIPDTGLAAECLDDIRLAAERATDLTHELLIFSRKDKGIVAPVDIQDIVDKVTKLLLHNANRCIQIKKSMKADKTILSLSEAHLKTAILNLGLNSLDAMPDEGTVTLATQNVTIEEGHPGASGEMLTPGVYLELTVSDTGEGMSPKVQQRIFEPFFTTKPSGQGTGLGLAAVYACVKNAQGTIHVDSKPHQGTTVTLLLPLANEQHPLSDSPPKTIAGQGTILVVDDEKSLRKILANALTKLGYTVMTCRDGVEAVHYFMQHHAEIDLIILDLIMPRMAGKEAFREMKKIDPDVRVLICSGFSKEQDGETLLQEGARAFLQKPVHIAELSKHVAKHIRHSNEHQATTPSA